MLSRVLLAGVVCLLVVLPVQAEPTIHFRGKQLTSRHFVYGEVTASAQRSGTINLGYAHGVQEGQQVGVLRRRSGQMIPIGVLRLVAVRPGDAFGMYEGEFRLQRDDMIIVSARDLNVWQGRSRSNQLVVDSLLSKDQRGYDSGAISPALLDEVGRDDDLIARRPPPLHVNADAYSMLRPQVRDRIARGAFQLASSDEGSEHPLSDEDRRLSTDKPTLDLETAFARFVISNSSGRVNVDYESLRLLAKDLPRFVDPEDVRVDLDLANSRVRAIIQP